MIFLKVASKEKEQALRKYKDEYKVSSPILIDERGSTANAYGVWNFPQTFFINREGKIIARALREVDWTSNNMKDLIQSLLKEKK